MTGTQTGLFERRWAGPMVTVKALTVCQPYAHLIAIGEKRVENRTWGTHYRGPVAIHAGRSWAWMRAGDAEHYPGMAFGAVVAVAELAACLHICDVRAGRAPDGFEWVARHAHTEGPFCWVLGRVERVGPYPCGGAQGLWDAELPMDMLRAAEAVESGHG